MTALAALPLDALLLDALRLSALLAGPVLLALLVVGLVVGLVQAWLNVHDVAVSAAPRWLAGAAAVLLFGGWMARELLSFATHTWSGGAA